MPRAPEFNIWTFQFRKVRDHEVAKRGPSRRKTTGVLYDRKVPARVTGRQYMQTTRLAIQKDIWRSEKKKKKVFCLVSIG